MRKSTISKIKKIYLERKDQDLNISNKPKGNDFKSVLESQSSNKRGSSQN